MYLETTIQFNRVKMFEAIVNRTKEIAQHENFDMGAKRKMKVSEKNAN